MDGGVDGGEGDGTGEGTVALSPDVGRDPVAPRAPTPPSGRPVPAGSLQQVRTQRGQVDYALQRRALLAGVLAGRTGVSEVCDASPYLLRAAKYHGVATDITCPLCRKEALIQVYWVYGDEIKHMAGSARLPAELETMAGTFGEFSVYQVEVCRTCSWNHLVSSFVMGHHGEQAPRARRRAGE